MATAILYPPTTPTAYHRIISPTLEVPEDPTTSIPVGLLACQRDPLLREILTTVISCSVSQPQSGVSKKANSAKKAVLAPTLPSGPLLEVILHDTVIFPEGGGQPSDTGTITTATTGQLWTVVMCKRVGGHAVHFVSIPAIGGEHGVLEAVTAFSTGAHVIASLDEAGWTRRYDHMTMHTSQHMLSALLESRLNLPTLSWSLTASPSPCYVEVPRGMTAEEILSIQTEANRLVFEGRMVYVEVEELDRSQVAPVEQLESGRAVGKALPDDYTGGVKRVIIIDGVDRNPCCGTHLPSLHNLQLFILPHTETLSRSSTTSARLYFLAGPRLITHLTSSHSFLMSAANTLSCGAPLVPERVVQVVDDRRSAVKRVEELERELAEKLAVALVPSPESPGIVKKHMHRMDDSGNALGFLNAIAAAFIRRFPSLDHLIVLSTSTGTSSIMLIFGSQDQLVKHVGEEMKKAIGVKGGGKGLKWSGKLEGGWKVIYDKAISSVLEA